MFLKGCVNGCFFGLLILLFSVFFVPNNGYSQNLPPVINLGIPNQHTEAGEVFSYPIPLQAFKDENFDSLTYSVDALPAWLSFDPVSGKFSGTPLASGIHSIVVMAKDPAGLSISTGFKIFVHAAGSTYAAFSMKNTSRGCGHQVIEFINRSKGVLGGLPPSDPSATSCEWILGNGNTSTEAEPSAIYDKPGTYVVKLTINGGGSPENTFTDTIRIFPKPKVVISVSPENGCEPLDLLLTSAGGGVTEPGFVAENGQVVHEITGGAASYYNWFFFEKLPTATTFEPSLQLDSIPAGNYNGGLKITDENGCSNHKYSIPLFSSYPVPQPSFTIDKEDDCRPSKVDFINTTSGSLASYEWTVNDTPAGSGKNFSTTFNAFGDYSVGLVCTSVQGCRPSAMHTETVSFNNNNQVDFSFENLCFGDRTRFTSAVSPGIVDYKWDFDGNGTIDDSTANPEHEYLASGNFQVQLQATFNDGCTKDTIKSVEIEHVSAIFKQEFTGYCPYKIRFTDQSLSNLANAIATRKWYLVEQGNPDLLISESLTFEHTFGNGKYGIRLEVSSISGCTGSVYQEIDLSDPVIDFLITGKRSGCIVTGETTSFTVLVSNLVDEVLEYVWNFHDGTTVSTLVNQVTHEYTTAGNFDVSCTIKTKNGCQFTGSKPAAGVAFPPAISNFTAIRPDNCYNTLADLSTEYSAGTDHLEFTFPDPDGKLTLAVGGTANVYPYQFPDVGNFQVSVTAIDNGCRSAAVSLSNLNVEGPKADFETTENAFCNGPTQVAFLNKSHADPGTIFSWNFGDGSPVLVDDNDTVKYFYGLMADYPVSLMAETPGGCRDTLIDTLQFYSFNNTPGIISATPKIGCVPLKVTFGQNIRTHISGNFIIENFLWDFNNDGITDDTTKNELPFDYTFTKPGHYSVTLRVEGENGCDFYFTENDFIQVNGPIPSFTFPTPCINQETAFFNTTVNVGTDQSKNSFHWDFGDGTTLETDWNNVTHIYTDDTTYTVKLTITDEAGCVNTDSTNISIKPLLADFKVDTTVCINTDVEFINQSDGDIKGYRWDFNGDTVWDLETPANTNPVYSYPSAGTYQAKLEVQGPNACTQSKVITVHVTESSTDFHALEREIGCAPAFAYFEVDASAADVKSYKWDFGDGNTSNERNPRNFYTLPGYYRVSLVVEFLGGCSDTIIKPANYIFVDGAYGEFSYDNTSGCAPNLINFTVSSMRAVETITWDYGIGITDTDTLAPFASEASKSYVYTGSGKSTPFVLLSHEICGEYAYDNGLLGSISTSLPPVAGFKSDYSEICQGVPIQFADTSKSNDPVFGIGNWKWIFPDTVITGTDQPDYAFSNPGTYSVSLITFNSAGCSDTVKVSDQWTIYKNLVTSQFHYNPNNSDRVCPGQEITFTNTSYSGNGNIVSWQWKFGDGQTAGNLSPALHTYVKAHEGEALKAWLIATDEKQCTDSTSSTVNINKLQAAFGYEPQPVFRGKLVDFSDSSTTDFGTIDHWNWTFDTGEPFSSNGENPHSIVYPNIGENQSATLRVTNSLGCRDTAITQFNVLNNLPTVSSFDITFLSSTTYTFSKEIFDNHFDGKDPGQLLSKIKILSLPANATLTLFGANVSIDQEILTDDLDSLKLHAPANYIGSTSFEWNGFDGYHYAASPAVVNVNIEPYPEKAQLEDLFFYINKDSTITITSTHFNDHFFTSGNWSWLPITRLTILSVPDQAKGSLTLNGVKVNAPVEIDSARIDFGSGLKFKPVDGFGETVTFEWTARDQYNVAADTAKVHIVFVNRPPIMSNIVRDSLPEDQDQKISKAELLDHYRDDDRFDRPVDFYLYDIHNHHGTWKVNGLPVADGNFPMAISSLSEVSFTPNTGFEGTDSVKWIVSDGTDTDTALIILNYINSPPVVHKVRFGNREDHPVNFTSAGFSKKFPDGAFEDRDQSDELDSIRIETLPGNGILYYFNSPVIAPLTVPTGNINLIRFVPDQDWNGQSTLSYNGYDGTNWAIQPDSVILDIAPVNDTPVARDTLFVIDEDQVLSGFSLRDNGHDIDNLSEELRVALENGGTAALNGTITLLEDGSLEFTPTKDYYGTVSFTYRLCDQEPLCSFATVSIRIDPVNDAPLAENDSFETFENQDSTQLGSVLDNDSDVDGDQITMIGVQNENGLYGRLAWLPDGILTYYLHPGLDTLKWKERVMDVFVYTNSDPSGLTGSDTIVVTINGLNDSPVSVNDRYSANQNDTLTVGAVAGWLANDSDIDGDNFTVGLVDNDTISYVEGNLGAIDWETDGSFRWIPDDRAVYIALGDSVLEKQFAYWIKDEYGQIGNASTVSIWVNGVNDPPLAVNDTLTFNESMKSVEVKTGAYPALLENDGDPDQHYTIKVIAVNGTDSGKAYGRIGSLEWASTGAFTFFPDDTVRTLAQDKRIYDYFTYVLSDEHGSTDTATLVITVVGLNDPPSAINDYLSILEDQHSTVVPPENGMLSNDREIDFDPLVASINGISDGFVPGRYGQLEWDALGSFTYLTFIDRVDSLYRGQKAEDLFVYKASDPYGYADSANLVVQITGQNDPPYVKNKEEAINEKVRLLERTSRETGFLSGDTDIDGDAFGTIKVNGFENDTIAGKFGQLIWDWDGRFTYSTYPEIDRLKQNEEVVDSFLFVVRDQFQEGGLADDSTASAFLLVKIIGENDPPVAVNDTLRVSEDTIRTLSLNDEKVRLTYNDQNAEGDPVRVVLMGGSADSLYKGRFSAIGWDSLGNLSYQRAMDMYLDTMPLGTLARDSVQYTIADPLGARSKAWLHLILYGENDAPVAKYDSLSIGENSRYSPTIPARKGLLANDVELDRGDFATIKTDTDTTIIIGKYGSLQLNGDKGAYIYRLDSLATDSLYFNEIVYDTLVYQITDQNDAVDTSFLKVMIFGENDAPVAINDTIRITEETESFTTNIIEHDVDVDGDQLTLISMAHESEDSRQYGELTWKSDGSVVFTINIDAVDSLKKGDQVNQRFRYSITDKYDTVSASIIIEINGLNDTPVVSDIFISIHEKKDSLSVLAPDSLAMLHPDQAFDIDGDSLSVVAVNRSNDPVAKENYGELHWNPLGGYTFYNYTDSTEHLAHGEKDTVWFHFAVADPWDSDTASLMIEIVGVNDPPVALGVSYQTTEYNAISKTVESEEHITCNDYDVDSESFSITSLMALVGKSASVSNSHSSTGMADVSLEELEMTSGLYGVMYWYPDGSFQYYPDTVIARSLPEDSILIEKFEYTITDDHDSTASSTIQIKIIGENNSPMAVSDTIYVRNSITPVELKAPGLLVNAIDYDKGDVLKVNLMDGGTIRKIVGDYGILEWDSTGRVVYTPDSVKVERLGPKQLEEENNPFEYTITDLHGAQSKAQLHVIIYGSNSPVSAIDQSVEVPEDSFLFINPKYYDPDYNEKGNIDSSSVRITTPPVHGVASPNTSTFEIFYRPDKNYFGKDSLKYRICDTEGSCDDAWAYINVIPVNDPPSGIDTVLNVFAGQSVSFDPLSRVSDIDDGIDPNTLEIANEPKQGTLSYAGGIYTFTADVVSGTSDEFVYSVKDRTGVAASVIVSVNILHQATLFAQDDHVETPEDTPITFGVLANDTISGNQPNPLSFSIKVHPLNGYVTVGKPGTLLTYVPFENYNGPDKLVYTICTDEGLCDLAEVHIQVTPINDGLKANDDAAFTTVGKPVGIDVLFNDTDPDGQPDPATVEIVDAPHFGSVTKDAVTGQVSYFPNVDFKGTDYFTYRVCDGTENGSTCDQALVSILVTSKPFNMIAVNDQYDTPANQPIVMAPPNHPLDNDLANFTQIDSASFIIVQSPANGTYTFDAKTRTVVYYPDANFWGPDLMRYFVCDTASSCDWADINIWVEPENRQPRANNDYFTVNENRSFRQLVLGNDFDPDGYLVDSTLKIIAEPENGLAIVDPLTGSVLYEPAINKGSDSYRYVVFDNSGGSDTASVQIDIDLGQSLVRYRTTKEDQPDTLDLTEALATINIFSPVDGMNLQNAPENGTLRLAEQNTRLIYQPNPDFNGLDTFKLGLLSSEVPNLELTVYMTVIPVADPPVAVNDTIVWNEPKNTTTITFNHLLHNDYDVDGDTIYLITDYLQSHPGFDGLSVLCNEADRTITLKTDSMEWCNAWFEYQIQDPDSLASFARVFIFPVLKEGDLVARNDRDSVFENSRNNTIDLLENDTFKDRQRCAIDTIELIMGPFHGETSFDSEKNLIYTPTSEYHGDDSLQYRLVNIWGQSDTAWVNIFVISVNKPPVAVPDLVIQPAFGKPMPIDVLINDYDPDDSIVTKLTVPITLPQHGTVYFDADGGKMVYTPTDLTCDPDSFRYAVYDNEGASSETLVTILPPESAPLSAIKDVQSTYPGVKVMVEPLINDEGYFIPVIDDYTNPANGSVVVGVDNLVTYTPDPAFIGRDSMTYTIVSPCGNMSSTTIVFVVEDLRVPEIITPNADGKNDVLIIDGIEFYPESILEIYNRYGHIVYSMRGYDNSWNGFSNKGSLGGDRPLPAATYYYTLKYNEGRNRKSGFIYLFR